MRYANLRLVNFLVLSCCGMLTVGCGSDDPRTVAALNSALTELYFAGSDNTAGFELWTTDGTAAGTVMVADISAGVGGSYPFYFTAFNGEYYFMADDGGTGDELWKTDGTAAGTVMVKDINPGAFGSSPRGFTVFNGKLYFSAQDGANGVG